MPGRRRQVVIAVFATSVVWCVVGVAAYLARSQIRLVLYGHDREPPAGRPDSEVRSAAAAFDRLRSIPYIEHAFDPAHATRGVSAPRPGRAAPGVNFYYPWAWGRGEAYLIDMEGRTLWRWTLENYYRRAGRRPWTEHFELLPDGSVIVVTKDDAVVKLDRDSRVLWATPLRAHHDASVAFDGRIWALSHARRLVPAIHPTVPIEADAISVLSPAGKLLHEIPVLKLLERSGYGYLLPRLTEYPTPSDLVALEVFHTNHVEVFDGAIASRSPLFRRGNFLVSIRNLNAIAIVDGETEKIVWLWGPGNLTYQHDPRLLADGHVLVFDNGTTRSQVVEVDPVTNEVVWRYAPPAGFFSELQGAVQRLDGGNTLITETGTGWVREIDPGGGVVWRFANPDVNARGYRNGIMRMTRFDPAKLTFLRR